MWIEHRSHEPPKELTAATLIEWVPTYWGHPRMDPFTMSIRDRVDAIDWQPGFMYRIIE